MKEIREISVVEAVQVLANAVNGNHRQGGQEIADAFSRVHSTLLNQIAGAVLQAVAGRMEDDRRIHPKLWRMAKEYHKDIQNYFV